MLVFGIAGNKCDKLEDEVVPKTEGEEFAKSIGAVFKLTSASRNLGINELFEELGKRYLIQNSDSNSKKKSKGVKLDPKKGRNKKKKCC